ncbi:NAD(P)-dependent oxidoreductase [Kitasatospora cinereorecta]|uniref:NAD(P)-dependent oxidoreductase n=1 Tax=Kitasatospora cinereorecta TaxID=285560 RepID=UPI0031F8897A
MPPGHRSPQYDHDRPHRHREQGATAVQVGFVGLGAMGREMTRRLLAAGHSVQVWNRSRPAVDTLVAEGARPAGQLADVFANEAVVSMLADDHAVESLLLDARLLESASTAVHVNMATVSPGLARRAAALHASHGVGYLAAPVLGRTDVAAAGNLNILAAGADPDIDRVEPLFEAMGRKTWRLGTRPEAANVAKICVNFMLTSAIESLSEATALAEANGLAAGDLLDLVTGTVFPGPVYAGYGAMIAERRYEPAGFRLALGRKDVGLALDTAAAAQVPLPLAELLREALDQAITAGHADHDLAALAETSRHR